MRGIREGAVGLILRETEGGDAQWRLPVFRRVRAGIREGEEMGEEGETVGLVTQGRTGQSSDSIQSRMPVARGEQAKGQRGKRGGLRG